MRKGLLIGLMLLGAAGCGGESGGEQTASAKETTAPKETATAAAGPEAEIKQAAELYLTGLAEKDWKMACESRAPSERKSFAQSAGSCEKVFETLLDNEPRLGTIFAEAKAGEVRIKGKTAGVDIMQPGQSKPAATLAAILEGGHWYLADIPDDQIP